MCEQDGAKEGGQPGTVESLGWGCSLLDPPPSAYLLGSVTATQRRVTAQWH